MSYDCVCDYDPATFYNRTLPLARKQHKCSECGGPILPGERYEYVAGLWDADWFDVFKTCEQCLDVRTWTKNSIPCLCWAHGSMIDDCKEAVEEAAYRAHGEAVGLRFGFLRRLVLAKRARKRKRAAL